MPRYENRGSYRVTVFSDDSELWQIRYTDGTFGHEHIIDSDSHFPVCCKCSRRWCPQDKDIRFDMNGTMTCPDCQ